MESLKYLHNIAPPLTISIVIAGVDTREEKNQNIGGQNYQHAYHNSGWNVFQIINSIPVKMVQQKQYNKPNQNWSLDDVILLDSGYIIKVTFMNPNLITNIKPIKNQLHVFTNAGTK